MPGYLFYNGALDDEGVNWIYNDRRFIGIRAVEGVPLLVSNIEIHRMRMAELAGSAEVLEVFSVIAGEVVEIVKGPYAGKIGVVRDIAFGKVMLDFPLDRQAAKFSVSELGKISFKP
jgi:transcription antitermination factor NusG